MSDLRCYRCRTWPCRCEDRATLVHGDCCVVMAALDADSVDAVVTDPPYGLEFMGKEWDRLDGGFSAPGIGARATSWPNIAGDKFAGYNPTCATCGGRLRGKKQCGCESPDWRIKGESLKASAVPKPGNLGGFADGNKPSFERVRSHLPAMQEWHHAWATQALRVLKPGGHLLAFGGTRTFHRLTCALEDAGFEIRDCLMWLYGSGFPKSHDVSKAIDKSAGQPRERIRNVRKKSVSTVYAQDSWTAEFADSVRDGTPITDEARQWSGWGTALKPAWEPIIVARKPLSESNVAANVVKHGTGGINVDACRIAAEPRTIPVGTRTSGNNVYGDGLQGNHHTRESTDAGRWPANVLLDDEAAAMLDEQTGTLQSGRMHAGQLRAAQEGPGSVCYGKYGGNATDADTYGDSGGASRFFYTAKADKQDRGPGNTHPTVKPLDLMRYLVRLVAPTGAMILDPFMGSGTTIVAARKEHCRIIGIEREAEYITIACRRLQQKVLAFPEDVPA